jgi:hypothetical protein
MHLCLIPGYILSENDSKDNKKILTENMVMVMVMVTKEAYTNPERHKHTPVSQSVSQSIISLSIRVLCKFTPIHQKHQIAQHQIVLVLVPVLAPVH